MAVALTTRLEAVNEILSVINIAPVSSIPSTARGAAEAERLLDGINREVQSDGWDFNTEHNVTLTANGSGEYVLATNVARVNIPRTSALSPDYVFRDGKLYDKRNHTSTFTVGDTVKASIVYLFDFDESPEAMRRYVTIRAARVMQDRAPGSQRHSQYNRQDELRAYSILLTEESTTGEANMLCAPDMLWVHSRRRPVIPYR